MKKFVLPLALVLWFFHTTGGLEAAESLRAASGGFTTAIHAVLRAAYEEKIFPKYRLDVEYLALNTGRLGMQMLLSDGIQVLFSTGVTVVSTNLQKADLAIIGGGLNFFPTKLIVRPEVDKPAAAGQTPETLRLLEPSVLDEIKKSGFVEKIAKQ